MAKLDMGYGNPTFLQELWARIDLPPVSNTNINMPYMITPTSLEALKQEIKQLHAQQKNCKITSKSRIIITAGAIQALQAAIYAYKQLDSSITHVYSPAPYWGRFDNLIAHEGLIPGDHKKSIILATTPNNPDGKSGSIKKAHIRDACYNWSHYSDRIVNFTDDVVVFSLAKMSGHASTRIGWAIVNNTEIANKMEEYIELFTSGVSFDAQLRAVTILQKINHPHFKEQHSFFELARPILGIRHAILRARIEHDKLPIIELSNFQGMFWYVDIDKHLLDWLNVHTIPGTYFKDKSPHKGMVRVRFNIGCSSVIFQKFLRKLRSA